MRKTRIMAEVAVSVSMAVICSFIKVWEMPQGGSVSLTMIPIILVSLRCGAACGVTAGALYGVISLMIAGVIYHPMSILLDYVLAFGVLGVSGFFKKNVAGIVCGTVFGVFGRFICSTISGATLFASYAPAGQNPWIYSLGYQATYLIPELIITLICVTLLYTKARRIFSR
ncbi:MAG: energy-coupled thiamine transporter ThiT [Ruminococcaceae bacterium]|nr:energy-coupled thiamine transporter ThiT [Oscillospiraceae bacterium]